MKKIVLALLIGILLLGSVGCGCSKKEKGKEIVQKEEIKEVNLNDQTVDNLKVSGINITYKDGVSELVANVENVSKKTIKLRILEIKLYDKDNNKLVETMGYIGDSIKKNENKQLITTITGDLRNTKKVVIKVKK